MYVLSTASACYTLFCSSQVWFGGAHFSGAVYKHAHALTSKSVLIDSNDISGGEDGYSVVTHTPQVVTKDEWRCHHAPQRKVTPASYTWVIRQVSGKICLANASWKLLKMNHTYRGACFETVSNVTDIAWLPNNPKNAFYNSLQRTAD